MKTERRLVIAAIAIATAGFSMLVGEVAIAGGTGMPKPIQKCDTAATSPCGCVAAPGGICFDPNDNRSIVYCTANGQTACTANQNLFCPATGNQYLGPCNNPGRSQGGCQGTQFFSC